MSDADWKWLLAHTEFNEVELQDMLSGNSVIYYTLYLYLVTLRMLLCAGFRIEYPGGGIYRHQLEQMTGNAVMNIVFKYIAIFIFIEAFI